jgi:hypothetical protein
MGNKLYLYYLLPKTTIKVHISLSVGILIEATIFCF